MVADLKIAILFVLYLEDTLVDLITLKCASDSFTVQVPKALLDGLQPEELVLENNVSCTGVNDSSDFVSITSKLGECGTELTETTVPGDVSCCCWGFKAVESEISGISA